ncbi:MAG: MFS transporter, partial [Gammaproteobacteria bacterium]
RGSWQFLLPIWGDHIGLNRGEIGVIFAISTLVDCVMLYPGGYTADRWGRKWSAIPGVAILSLSMLMLSSCLTFSALLLVAVLAGVANGISGGIIMTWGSDWAPRATRGTFLAVWRFLSDSSGALSPVLIAGLSSLWSLSGALYVSGAIGMMGGMLMLIWGQETVRKNRNADTSIE